MRKITPLTAAIGLAIAPVLFAAPAQAATLPHTWVASNGDNTATCDRTAPCATFAGALAKTDVEGEITCVDSGNYGGLNIGNSVTINCENAIGSTSISGSPGVISIHTLATDVVALRGLDIDGLGFPVNGGLINFFGAGVLHVHKVKMNKLRGGGNGITFNPSGTAKLFVSDSTITDNGSSGVSGGIVIKPASGVQADVTVDRTRIENNFFGIIADGTDGGIIHGVVRDSVVAGNANFGIGASTSTANVVLLLENTTITNNNYGLVAVGAGAGLAVRNSSILFNTTGLYAATGGVLGSYKNNSVGGNGTDGAFTVVAAQQ